MKISYEQWVETYKPILNPVRNSEYNGFMFETHGVELELVHTARKTDPENRVWTLIDTDGADYIVNGYHIVNRLGYFITEVPFMDSVQVFSTSESDIPCFELRVAYPHTNCPSSGYWDVEADFQLGVAEFPKHIPTCTACGLQLSPTAQLNVLDAIKAFHATLAATINQPAGKEEK